MGTIRSIIAGMAAVTLSVAVASGFPRDTTDSRDSVQRFHSAIDAYVALRETVTEALPPLEMSPDPEKFLMVADAMAAALREARPSAADARAPLPPRPIVHDQFDWSWGSFTPACVLSVLPSLPDQLQFRFVQRDLVLVDIDADLVVDVLPDALLPIESWKGLLYAGSSQVSDRAVPTIPRLTGNGGAL